MLTHPNTLESAGAEVHDPAAQCIAYIKCVQLLDESGGDDCVDCTDWLALLLLRATRALVTA